MGLTKPTKSQIPQSRMNKAASLGKNLLRLVAFGFLAYYEIQAAAVLLIVAELIAIAEQRV
jgi:hypothetical protein